MEMSILLNEWDSQANVQHNIYFKFMALPLFPVGSPKVQCHSTTVGHCQALLGQLGAEVEENVSH